MIENFDNHSKKRLIPNKFINTMVVSNLYVLWIYIEGVRTRHKPCLSKKRGGVEKEEGRVSLNPSAFLKKLAHLKCLHGHHCTRLQPFCLQF